MGAINIRAMRTADYSGLNKIRTADGVVEYILSTCAETEEETIYYFSHDCCRNHIFIAENSATGEPVGYLVLKIEDNPRRAHKAKLSMAVLREYQSHGVGKMLMNKALDYASNWLKLKIVELIVLYDNDIAVNFYKNCGFVHAGVLKYDTIVDGVYKDVNVMTKLLTDNFD